MLIRKSLFSQVCKGYPGIRNHYRLLDRARRAVSKDAGRGTSRETRKNAGELAAFLAERLTKSGWDLMKLAEEFFESRPPEDDLLFLFEDAAGAALLLYLSEQAKSGDRDSALGIAADAANKLDVFDFEELYLRFSRVDRILRRRNYLFYPECDAESKAFIRALVRRFASSHGISETDAANLIREDESERTVRKRTRLFSSLALLLSLLLFSTVSIVCGILEAFLLLLPLISLCAEVLRTGASLFISPAPILKLKDKKIDERIVTVVTVLLQDEKEPEKLARHLERMYLQNREENVVFGLLADLKDARTPTLPEDKKIAESAVREIRRLNERYKNRFCLFLRGRSYAPGEKTYMGWERKRGALIELNRFLTKGVNGFDKVILPEGYLKNTSYILTLDADTELRIGAVSKMYAAMKHPCNRPVVKNGTVVSGYGVLQPRMATGVESAGKTPFSALFSGGVGSDSYQNAVFDFYQSVFGKGAFCGKGMFDTAAFDAVIDGAFPEGRILSHDLLEGTRLRCGYLSELILTDSSPATVLSYLKRQHRWIRGDLQSLPFALPRLPFSKTKTKNPIDGVSKWMLISNAVRALTPLSALVCLIFSALLGEENCALFLLLSFGYLLFPLVCTLLRTAKNVGRRFYSTVMQNVWLGICRTLFSLCALCRSAFLSLDALVRVLFRSFISGKKLLEWVTASEGEKSAGSKKKGAMFFALVRTSLPSLIAALLLFLFTPGGVVRLLSLLFLLFPAAAFFLSLPFKERSAPDDSGKEALKSFAEQSFSYFERFVSEKDNFLPPDNYQEAPVSALAHRTSPTNIALYLLSVAAMKDLGYLSEKEMLERLEKTLKSVCSLPKFKGHLYNWFDTKTLDILGQPYISTVDSGNFALCLCALAGSLAECRSEKAKALRATVKDLLEKTDFSFLLNEKKGLLCIGYDPVEGKQSANCYDLLASEARSAYFYAIAKRQIPAECWSKLGRPVTVREGHLGLLSWSGTAFEYFMPTLFLPVYKNTLLYEALCFALYEQQRDRAGRLWGRSECGYFAFDDDMNYQYKAFGSARLALDPSIAGQNVLAPYASFLALSLAPAQALSNLRRLKEAGACGAYGFYEAIDLTPERVGQGGALIRSYMSHHVGMSVVACANAVLNDIFVRRAFADKELEAASELLKESVPCDAQIAKVYVKRSPVLPRLFSFSQQRRTPGSFSPERALLYRGGACIRASSKGFVTLSVGQRLLTPPELPEKETKHRLSVGFESREERIDLLDGGARFFFDGAQCVYALQKASASFFLSLRALPKDGFLLHAETSSHDFDDLLFSSPLLLCPEEDFRAHPAFAGLCVECAYLKDEKILLFHKRFEDARRPSFFCACACADEEDLSFISSFDDLDDLDDLDDPDGLTDEKKPREREFRGRTGALRKPYLVIKKKLSDRRSCELLLFCSDDREKALSALREARAKAKEEDLFTSLCRADKQRRKDLPSGVFPDRVTADCSSLLLEGCARFRKSSFLLPAKKQEDLWRYSISGDCPIFTFLLPDAKLSESQKKVLSALFRAHAYLTQGGVHCDLVFIKNEEERYFSPFRAEFDELLKSVSGSKNRGSKGGIRLLTDRGALEVLPSFSRVCLTIDENCIFPSFRKSFLSCLAERPQECTEQIERSESRAPEKDAAGGTVFGEEGFTVVKKSAAPPFSLVLCGRQFGTLVTHRSLGFTWLRNAGEFRLTPFSGDEAEGCTGEKLVLTVDRRRFDLCACSDSMRFDGGRVVYAGKIGDLSYELSVGVDLKYPVKLLRLLVRNEGEQASVLRAGYEIFPCLGRLPDGNVTSRKQGETLFIKRTADNAGMPFCMFVSPAETEFSVDKGKTKTLLFLLGTSGIRNDRCFYAVRSRFDLPEKALEAYKAYAGFYKRSSSVFSLRSGDKALDRLVNGLLPYQVLTARLFGRTGFYQPGGAYGYRDQLQDALCLLNVDPDLLKIQIYRCAAHQYEEGDVQHWWHTVGQVEGKADLGVRTNCSDDLLFLPYAVSEYLRVTGDRTILEKEIGFLSSPPLKTGQDRCERPKKGQRKEKLYFHCLRAIERAASRRSARNLLLIGSCDWNDGFSEVKGESVWLTQFFCLTLRRFLPFARDEERAYLSLLIAESKKALDPCFCGGRYLRAFFENGRPLGKKGDPYCAIDLLPQAFSVFLENSEKSRTAIDSAWRLLRRKDCAVFRLFAPSYDKDGPFPGYLGGYCPGFRENGGQYTHAAVWGAMALLRAGEHEKGYEILSDLIPEKRVKSFSNYALEPYALAGDVYSAKGYEGRGGWSLYTGSAGWLYKAILEDLLGYREENGGFSLHPRLSPAFPSFELEVRKKGTIYRISAESGEKDLLLLDGKECSGSFLFDGRGHILKMVLQKTKEWCKIEEENDKLQ